MDRIGMATAANRRAVEIRRKANVNRTDPVNIYDLAMSHFNLRVQFLAGGSFEGMFAKEQNTIVVPAERPHGRRAFAAAHEFGHWAFGHGSQIDEIGSLDKYNEKPEERLVNLFGGFLLMPLSAIQTASSEIDLNLDHPTPAKIYQLSCWLGVGYTTVINHLRWSLQNLSASNAEMLGKVPLKTIRSSYAPEVATKHLFVTNEHSPRTPIDLEVGDHIILPSGTKWLNKCLIRVAENKFGTIAEASRAGICLVNSPASWSAAVRVMRKGFTGWAKYRHLESDDDEND